jgi:hypothetical protein
MVGGRGRDIGRRGVERIFECERGEEKELEGGWTKSA